LLMESNAVIKSGFLSFGIILFIIFIFPFFSSNEITYPYFFIQLSFYDKYDNFIGYSENVPQVFNPSLIISWLEFVEADHRIVSKNGYPFHVFQFEDTVTESDSPSLGAYYLRLPFNEEISTVLYFSTNSFHFEEGDYAKVSWTVIYPVS